MEKTSQVTRKTCHSQWFTKDVIDIGSLLIKNPMKDCIIAKFSIRNFKDERLTLSGRTESIGRSFRHLSNIISTLPQHSCHGGQSRKMSQYKHCRNESVMSSKPGWNVSLQYSASPGIVSHKLSIRSHGWLWATHHQPYTTLYYHTQSLANNSRNSWESQNYLTCSHKLFLLSLIVCLFNDCHHLL